METYSQSDLRKMIIDEATAGDVTTTYVGTCDYKYGETSGLGYDGDEDKGRNIWRIKKTVADSSTGITEVSYPNGSTAFSFSWNDRATLDYK